MDGWSSFWMEITSTQILSQNPISRHALYQGNNKSQRNASFPTPVRISSSPTSDLDQENLTDSSDMIIRNYQHQIENLQRKLRISTNMCTEQEIEYKNALREVELNFHRILSQRDDFIKLRESESNNQQQLISHLQTALEKLEKANKESHEIIQQVNETSKSQSEKIESLSQELSSYNKSFNNLSMVLLPDMRNVFNGNVEEMNKLTVNSVSTIVEKILICHKKDKEMLQYQIQTLENKLNDSDKMNEEKISYEKKLAEIEQKEQKNQLVKSIELKDVEIESLKDSLVSFELESQNQMNKLKEEVNKYKNTLTVKEHSSSENCKKLYDEKEKYLQTISKLKVKNKEITDQNLKYQTEFKNIEGINKNHLVEMSKNNQTLKEIRQENLTLKKELDEFSYSSEQNIKQLKSTINLQESELKEKTRQYSNAQQQIQQLTEHVKLLPIEIQQQEKEKYISKMEEVDRLFDNHKSVLENANVEMQSKDQLLKAAHKQITMLQRQNEDLQKVNKKTKEMSIELHTNISQRDSRLVDCQLKMSELKEKINDFSAKEAQNNKSFEKSQKMILKLQENLNCREKEKQSLQLSYNSLKKQHDELQDKLNKALVKVNSKDADIELLKRERKAVAKKIKEKNDGFVSLQQKQEITSCNIDALKESNIELQKSCEDLVKKNTNLSNALQILETEKKDLEKGILDQENVKDKEIETLLKRLHGSEVDIMKLKKLLKKVGTSDTTSAKMANASQRLVTKQRAEVDNLRIKINWMKEAFDVSEKTRITLQQELENKDEDITELQEKLSKEQKASHYLSANLSIRKQETHELHKALEQAASKYSDVYALVEKQESFARKVSKPKSEPMRNQTFEEIMKKDSMEIKTLLENVKDLLSSTLKKNSSELSNLVTSSKESESRLLSSRASGRSKKDIVDLSEPQIGSNSVKLNDYLSQHSNNSLEEISSASFRTFEKIMPVNSTPKSRWEKQNDTSSVYSIDYTSDIESIHDSLFEVTKEQSLPTQKPAANNAAARLQKKLLGLQKMGEDLTTNNKEFSEMMKNHSTKLGKLTVQ